MPKFSNVLIPVDFSDVSDDVFGFGMLLAQRHDAALHLMHDIEIPTETITGATIVKDEMKQAHADSERRLSELERLADGKSVTLTRDILHSTDPKRSILTFAGENDIDLIVLGTHGRSKTVEKVLGSTAERVLRRSPCPTVTVRPGMGRDRIDVILVPVDFSEFSAQAVKHASDLGKIHGAEVVVLHAAADPPEDDVEQRLRRLYAEHGAGEARFIVSVAPDRIDEAVVEAAAEQDADLIVMMTHGRTGIRRALTTSVAERVVRRAPCPVMTYRIAHEEDRNGTGD